MMTSQKVIRWDGFAKQEAIMDEIRYTGSV